jgi:nucleotide-binding universal stress UspA family protein
MKIMATFDGSRFSESIVPRLAQLAALPDVEMILVTVAEMPRGVRRDDADHLPAGAPPSNAGGAAFVVEAVPAEVIETKEQAVERREAELTGYLCDIAARLPTSARYRTAVLLGKDAAATIVKLAITEDPDMIVMATHGHTGLARILFGDVAESVVRSGVAPILLVHPAAIKESRTSAPAEIEGSRGSRS